MRKFLIWLAVWPLTTLDLGAAISCTISAIEGDIRPLEWLIIVHVVILIGVITWLVVDRFVDDKK